MEETTVLKLKQKFYNSDCSSTCSSAKMNRMWKKITISHAKAKLYGVETVTLCRASRTYTRWWWWWVVCGGVRTRSCGIRILSSNSAHASWLCVCVLCRPAGWQQTSTSPLTRQKPKSESVLTRRRYIHFHLGSIQIFRREDQGTVQHLLPKIFINCSFLTPPENSFTTLIQISSFAISYRKWLPLPQVLLSPRGEQDL